MVVVLLVGPECYDGMAIPSLVQNIRYCAAIQRGALQL